MKVIEEGPYPDLPPEDYFSDPVPVGSLSQSGARLLLPPFTPHHFDHYRHNPKLSSRAQRLGTAAHAHLLGIASSEIEVHSDKDVKNYNKKADQEWKKKVIDAGRVPLLVHEKEKIDAMVAALRRHPKASRLLRPGEGTPEVSIFWIDEETGVWLRMRTDWLPFPREDGRVIIVDYKTVGRQADALAFSRALWEYGYYIQGPWYQAGVTAFPELSPYYEPDFVWIVQETEAPYGISMFELDPEDAEWGRKQMRRAIRTYARCVERGEWPSHPEEIQRASLPRWAHYQLADAARDGAFYDPKYDGMQIPGTMTPATYDDTYRGWDV